MASAKFSSTRDMPVAGGCELAEVVTSIQMVIAPGAVLIEQSRRACAERRMRAIQAATDKDNRSLPDIGVSGACGERHRWRECATP